MTKYLLFCLVAALTQSCSDSPEPRWKIGVSQPCDDEWRHKLNSEIEREALFHPEVSLVFTNGGNDSRLQSAQISELIESGIDLLIVAPNEARQVTPIIKKAYDAGIPVVTFDRNVYGDSYTAHFEPDNEGIGRQAALYARHILPLQPINALEIRGLDHSTPAWQRHTGFKGVADSLSDFNLISVGADWNAERAAVLADSVLRLHPEINVIYAHNDHMAMAASEVVRKAGRRDIKIFGTDAVPEVGLKAVADGSIDATFIYPTEGERLLDRALDILEGKPFPREEVSGSLSSVDRSNADILKRQYDLLNDETEKVEFLLDAHKKLDFANRAQTRYIYMMGIGIFLLLGLLTAGIIVLRQRHRFQKRLADKNAQLEEEKQKQLELYRQLDEATRSKLVFYTNVSHDLRTPLSLIAAPVEKLAKTSYLHPEDRALVGLMEKNVGILRRLIDQLLDFRKYENGKLELHFREIDFAEMSRDWVEYFREMATSRDISLEIEISNPSGLTMKADPMQLERVVFNLLSNAFRFTPDNGRILFKCEMTDEELRFSVEDNGAGIAEEDLNRVFDRFFQSADRKNSGGSGIGLCVSRAIIELHDGSISVESRKGGPTRFSVVIPVRHLETQAGSEPMTTAESGKNYGNMKPQQSEPAADMADESKPLLLIIDDNPDLIILMRNLLREDFRIIGAGAGPQGIALAARYVPDLIICDLYMPGTDGLEVCRILKSEVATSHIPILMLTASPDEEKRTESYDSGADGFLAKPFDIRVLRSRLLNLMENRRRLSSADSSSKPGKQSGEQGTESSVPEGKGLELESDFYRAFLNEVRIALSDPELTVEDLAGRIGLSQGQLTRKIKALTNYTPVEIIRKIRLQEARRLLLSTEKSISEITYEVGFSSPAYFSKCFRDAYRMTPRDFRASLAGQEEMKRI